MATKTINVRMQQPTYGAVTTDPGKILLNGEIILFRDAPKLGNQPSEVFMKIGDGSELSTLLPLLSFIPVGTVIGSAASQPYPGFLVCNGDAVLRGTYSRLYRAIGVQYGSGNGSTTFNLPNLLNKYPKGWGDTGSATGGSNEVTLTLEQMPQHNHATDGRIWSDTPGSRYCNGSGEMWQNKVELNTSNRGASQAHNNEPAYTKLYYSIKY